MIANIPPQAVEEERAILGAILMNSDILATVKPILSLDCFYDPQNSIIYRQVVEMHTASKIIDLMSVTRALKDSGLLENVGGVEGITRLVQNLHSAINVEMHAHIVAEKYYLRSVIAKCSAVIQSAYNNSEVLDVQNELKGSMSDLDDIFAIADTGSTAQEVVKSTLEDIAKDRALAQAGRAVGIPSNIYEIDHAVQGWRGGNMIVLAARPGVGKTSLALHFVLEAAFCGYWVNLFSYEMLKEDLCRIMLARESGVYRSNIRDGILDDNEWAKLNEAAGVLEGLPIIFKDAIGQSVDQIEATVRQNKKAGRCDFVVVDYLQLISSESKGANREREVAKISRTLKKIALTQNVPVMALSQLNRSADSEQPKLSHLRESGAIEQDADMVVLLSKDPELDGICFDVAKNRRGNVGELMIYGNSQMTKFSDTKNGEYER